MTLGVFEDRFGWPSCPLPSPASQDQEDWWRLQDRFGWPCCPLLLPQEDGVIRIVWLAKLPFAVVMTLKWTRSQTWLSCSSATLDIEESSKQDRKLIVVNSACCRFVIARQYCPLQVVWRKINLRPPFSNIWIPKTCFCLTSLTFVRNLLRSRRYRKEFFVFVLPFHG